MLDRPKHFTRSDVESALMDAEGDFLLFDLAFEALMEHVDEGRQKRTDPDEAHAVMVDEDQVTAFTHARGRLWQSLKAMSEAFYGEKKP